MKRFTDEDRAVIEEMFRAHRPVKDIASLLGRSVGTIRQIIHHSGWRRPARVTIALRRVPLELANRFDAAKPEEFIAISEAYTEKVRQAEREMKVALRAARQQKINELEALHRADEMPRDVGIIFRRLLGRTLQELGDHYGVTRERIRQICAYYSSDISLDDGEADDLPEQPKLSVVA